MSGVVSMEISRDLQNLSQVLSSWSVTQPIVYGLFKSRSLLPAAGLISFVEFSALARELQKSNTFKMLGNIQDQLLLSPFSSWSGLIQKAQ